MVAANEGDVREGVTSKILAFEDEKDHDSRHWVVEARREQVHHVLLPLIFSSRRSVFGHSFVVGPCSIRTSRSFGICPTRCLFSVFGGRVRFSRSGVTPRHRVAQDGAQPTLTEYPVDGVSYTPTGQVQV